MHRFGYRRVLSGFLSLGLCLSVGACDAGSSQNRDKDSKSSQEDSDNDTDDTSEDADSKNNQSSDSKNDSTAAKPVPLKGNVVDADGRALKGALIKICNDDGCLNPENADEQGKFEVEIPGEWPNYHVTVVMESTAGKVYSGVLLEIHNSDGEPVQLSDLTILSIPDAKSLESSDTAKSLQSGDLELKVVANDVQWWDTDKKTVGAVRVPTSALRGEEKRIEGHTLLAAWSLAPMQTSVPDDKPGIQWSIQDDLGLSKGDKVLAFEQHAISGKWKKVGEGIVDNGAIKFERGLHHLTRVYVVEP